MATTDPPPAPQFDRKNLVNATIIATLSAGALAATLYAPRWPIPCAIISLFIVAFAAVLRISLITTSITVPTVRIVSSLPITATAPIARAEQEIVTTAPETVVTVLPPDLPRPEQSSDHVAAAVQHAPRRPSRIIPPAPPVG